jgi:hypothetical protein
MWPLSFTARSTLAARTETFSEPASPARFSRSRLILTCLNIFLLSAVLRIGLLFATKSYHFVEVSEVQSIAASLAQHSTFANAYGPNTGPTAHTTPIYPLAVSILYRIFGTGRSGEIAQETFNCLIAALVWALMPVLSAACRMDPRIGIWAGFAGAVVPVNRWAETKGAFETTLGALFFVTLFAFYMRCWHSRNFRFTTAIVGGVLSGLAILAYASLASCAVGLLIVGYFILRPQFRHKYLLFALTTVAVTVLTLLPWALRNYFTLGGMVWTRSNFPLELSLSNNDMARANFADNQELMNIHHPRVSRMEKEKLRAVGELEYERLKQKEAFQWITSHPSTFGRLTMQRIFYFWFPSMKRFAQTILLIPLTAGGLWGLFSLVKTRCLAGYGFLTILAVFPVVYYVVQSFPRYVCPIEWSLFYLSAYQGLSLMSQLRPRSEARPLAIKRVRAA